MKWLKVGAVVFGALAITALGIDAADTLNGSRSTLLGELVASTNNGESCAAGMVKINMAGSQMCVDAYEESPSSACPNKDPNSQIETQQNSDVASCVPASQPNVMPWRYVSLIQAQQLCARAQKRLPTDEEWYVIASGLPSDALCTINSKSSSPTPTGQASCVTPAGVHDIVGNVWEWVDGQVVDNVYKNKTLPASGYVTQVDETGLVYKTAATASPEFGSDYAWTTDKGTTGIIRGGFYTSGSDAGIFAQNLSVPLDFRSAGIGFRCVK